MNAPQLEFKIQNVRPVELVDLTNSLLALGNEYQDFLSREHPEAIASEVRLYVNEVKSGSVIATLSAMSPLLLDGISYVNTVVDFASFLKRAMTVLSGNDDDANQKTELTPGTLKKPCANRGASSKGWRLPTQHQHHECCWERVSKYPQQRCQCYTEPSCTHPKRAQHQNQRTARKSGAALVPGSRRQRQQIRR